MNSPARPYSTLEILETRIAPAAVFTFFDTDGDAVKVTSSKGTNAQLAAAFTLSGGVSGNPTKIDLSLVFGVTAVFGGADISIIARPSALGDGFVSVGEIIASPVDLGKIVIDGDLGRIFVGDPLNAVPALKSLTVASLGALGTLSGAPDLGSSIDGRVGALIVKGDIANASVGVNGRIDALTVTGSVFGNITDSGFLQANSFGAIKIGGDLRGGAGDRTGYLESSGRIDSLTVGGSILGGGGIQSGIVLAGSGTQDIGAVKVMHNIKAGGGNLSGRIHAQNIASVTVGGSIVGGAGSEVLGVNPAGQIVAVNNLGPVKITGNLEGGVGPGSGFIGVGGVLTSLSIGGSIFGGAGSAGFSADSAGPISIVQDINSGVTPSSVIVSISKATAAFTVGGSILGTSGAPVLVNFGGGVGAFAVKGSLTNVRLEGGSNLLGGATMAFKSITVGGSVEQTTISAGSSVLVPVASEVQIGVVKVGGDWIASNLLCGVDLVDGKAGDLNDRLALGSPINTGTIAKIASITIKGQVQGTAAAGDQFGIVAEQIGSLSVGGKAYTLLAGPASAADFITLGATSDFKALEVLM